MNIGIGEKRQPGQHLKNTKIKSRPNIVTLNEPETQHFTNNKNIRATEKDRNEKPINNKPLILLAGDNMIKQVTSYDIRKKCGNVNVMVRSLQGAKIKNVKNLINDLLEDVKPESICIHASTNDINDDNSIDGIVNEMGILIKVIQNKGIVSIISLITTRNDKHVAKVTITNKKLIQLCNEYGVGYIEHENITAEHLNPGGLHIARQHNHLFHYNFARFFNFVADNNFCLL